MEYILVDFFVSLCHYAYVYSSIDFFEFNTYKIYHRRISADDLYIKTIQLTADRIARLQMVDVKDAVPSAFFEPP